jgi:exopolysaccharide biosynthesis protein
MLKVLIFLILIISHSFSAWKTLESGLELGTFHSPVYPDSVNATIYILRIDPSCYTLNLFCASSPDQGKALSAKRWCKKEHLVAAINASMYQQDYKTSVSLMKYSGHTNNSYMSKDKTIIAFNPRKGSVPDFRIIDRQCDDFSVLKHDYSTFIQSVRMISCTGKNVWAQGSAWSIASIGSDKNGKILFIFSSNPHTVHDFISILQKLPINIDRAMYLDGGHIAQMAIQSATLNFEGVGQFNGLGYSPAEAPEIPNVIGIIKK